MLKRIFVILLLATTASAQTSADLEKRLDEMKQQIEILTKEIETLKAGEQTKAAETGVSFGGYGEFGYQNPEHGTPSADFARGVLYTDYKFSDRVVFKSELEVEHGTTEIGGSVSLEFAHLDYLLKPQANIRAGLVLLPMGIINEQHEPTTYLGATRPEVEGRILPTTWSELGAGVFGDIGAITYRGYVVTGLDSRRFSAEDSVHEGKQSGSEALAHDLAITGRLDWHPFEGALVGASVYSGGSGQGRGYKGNVTLADVHADAKFRGVSLRGVFARGHIGDAATISEQNGQTIGSSTVGWYVEGGYELPTPIAVTPYVRYERLDTQRRVPLGLTRDPENDRRITSFGFAFKPISQTVIKTEYEMIHTRAGSKDNQFNLALGYIF